MFQAEWPNRRVEACLSMLSDPVQSSRDQACLSMLPVSVHHFPAARLGPAPPEHVPGTTRRGATDNTDQGGVVSGSMASSDPTHDFGTDGAARRMRVSAEAYGTLAAMASGLGAQPTASLALVLGFVAGSDAARSTPGRLAAVADELERRGEYRPTLAALDPDLGQRIDLLVVADRGQRWRLTGRR